MAPWQSFSRSVEAHVDAERSCDYSALVSPAVDCGGSCVSVGSEHVSRERLGARTGH